MDPIHQFGTRFAAEKRVGHIEVTAQTNRNLLCACLLSAWDVDGTTYSCGHWSDLLHDVISLFYRLGIV